MSDAEVVVLAAAALLGGWSARPVAFPFVVALLAAAWVVRRPVVLWVAVGVAASVLAARSWAGVDGAPTTGTVRTDATVVADPVRVRGGVRVELRVPRLRAVEAHDGHDRHDRRPWPRRTTRLQATAATGSDAASLLASRLAGDRLVVEGRLRPVSPGSRAYLARRHIGTALTVTAAGDPRPGTPVARFANELRRTLVAGTDSMTPQRRALFTGLVIGDDRDQAPQEVDDFRAAGLTHLLAVSGQTVTYAGCSCQPLAP